VYKDPKKHGFQVSGAKTRPVLLEETTPEDDRKIDYVEEMEDSESESDESESDLD
jgi:hypothetical protein